MQITPAIEAACESCIPAVPGYQGSLATGLHTAELQACMHISASMRSARYHQHAVVMSTACTEYTALLCTAHSFPWPEDYDSGNILFRRSGNAKRGRGRPRKQ